MDQKKMQIEEKVWALTLTEKGESVIAIAEDVGGRKKSRLSTKKLGNIIATRNGSKKSPVRRT